MFVLLVELFARPHVSLCLYTRLVGLLEDLQSLLRSIVLRSVVGACSRDIVRINCFHTASCKWAKHVLDHLDHLIIGEESLIRIRYDNELVAIEAFLAHSTSCSITV